MVDDLWVGRERKKEGGREGGVSGERKKEEGRGGGGIKGLGKLVVEK